MELEENFINFSVGGFDWIVAYLLIVLLTITLKQCFDHVESS